MVSGILFSLLVAYLVVSCYSRHLVVARAETGVDLLGGDALGDESAINGAFSSSGDVEKDAETTLDDTLQTTAHDEGSAEIQLVLIEAEVLNGKRGLPLTTGFEVCPRDFASSVSLECVAPNAAKAQFTVNDSAVRTEHVKPFTIAGDNDGFAEKWKAAESLGPVTLGCTTPVGSLVVSGTFACGPLPSPSPAPEPLGVDADFCIHLPALSHVNVRSPDWVQDGDALVYKPDDSSSSTVGPNTAPLVYTFEVPGPSTYALTMDSETPHTTEHNDAWLTFDSITLRSGGENGTVFSGLKKPLKAYQNDAGRKVAAFSVDFDPHSFSTTQLLVPGRNYSVTLGARSTKFKFFGLILFPCTGDECVAGNNHWGAYLHVCGNAQ